MGPNHQEIASELARLEITRTIAHLVLNRTLRETMIDVCPSEVFEPAGAAAEIDPALAVHTLDILHELLQFF